MYINPIAMKVGLLVAMRRRDRDDLWGTWVGIVPTQQAGLGTVCFFLLLCEDEHFPTWLSILLTIARTRRRSDSIQKHISCHPWQAPYAQTSATTSSYQKLRRQTGKQNVWSSNKGTRE
jgi:hypothetical protein